MRHTWKDIATIPFHDEKDALVSLENYMDVIQKVLQYTPAQATVIDLNGRLGITSCIVNHALTDKNAHIVVVDEKDMIPLQRNKLSHHASFHIIANDRSKLADLVELERHTNLRAHVVIGNDMDMTPFLQQNSSELHRISWIFTNDMSPSTHTLLLNNGFQKETNGVWRNESILVNNTTGSIHIFIPLLCYNHLANTEWMMSIFHLFLFLKENNIPATIVPITFDSLVSRARNAAVAQFLSNPQATHILFIDADIQFTPEQVMQLFHVNKEVVAAGYPQKWLSEEKMSRVFSSKEVPKRPFELVTHIPVHLFENLAPSHIMEAEYVTTGFLLIQRSAFERMMQQYPERKYRNDIDGYMSANPDAFYDFFPVMIHPETKRLESEDYGFSRLWRETGGKIYIVTDMTLTHHGWYGFKGNLYRQLTTYTS